MFTRAASLVALVVLSPFASAQQITLAETPASGECARYSVELDLAGKMIITQENTKESVKLEAKARHVFSERTLTTADGLPAKSARHYEEAVASAVVDVERVNRALPDDRRLV